MGRTTPYTSGFSYNADDQPVTTTLPNGVAEATQYDGSSRPLTVTATGLGPTTLAPSVVSYGYNALGWTTGLTATIGMSAPLTQTLAHDAEGRLTGAQAKGVSQGWGYDGNGNLLTATTNGVTTTYDYNASMPNELQTLTMPGQATRSYAYDGNGDTTSITSTSGLTTRLQYDSQARLVGVSLADGTRVSQSYNAARQRASYTVTKPGQSTLTETFSYRGDTLGQAVVTQGTTTYTDTYLYRPDGTPLELLRQQGGQTRRYWYVLDGRSNVIALTDSNGRVMDAYAYDAWGQSVGAYETVAQPFRYASYWYDAALGWYWVSIDDA